LGKPEHLKNPSLQNVYDYFNTYYVPNNMAICLSGDFDPDSMIVMIDSTFGKMEKKDVPAWVPPVEKPITSPVVKEVIGPDMESVMLGFRFPGIKSEDAQLLLLADYIMMNGEAGIIDLNLKQKQLLIDPFSGTDRMADYSTHFFGARPRENQTLEEAKDLLLAQIDSLKAGAFPDWLPAAAVNNLKLSETRGFEYNWPRAFTLANAFINQQEWEDVVYNWDYLRQVTKEDIIDFANKYYGDNYVVVYKKTGVDPNIIKIKKPPITPVELNRDKKSSFVADIEEMKSEEIQPVFIDYNTDITFGKMKNDINVLYKENTENDLFSMYYVADLGNDHNNKFGTALEYLNYLGTSKYTAEEFKQEMYKLACSFGVWSSEDQLQVYFSGLADSFEKGLELFEHLLEDAQPDKEALDNLVTDILKKRADSKLNKWQILNSAMYNYGVYGKNSPLRNILSEEELKEIDPEELTDLIKQLTNFKHQVLYYGPLKEDRLIELLNKYHKMPETFTPIPEPKKFAELPTETSKVYVCNYDMKQAEVIMISKSVPYNRDNISVRTLFNEYYGGNMSSVVFQTLRESKALAYSVWGSYDSPDRPDKSHYIFSYIGTQADKLGDALAGMTDLLNNMPRAENYFNDSKKGIINKIQTERITKASVLRRYLRDKRMGNDDHDVRIDIYSQVPDLTLDDIQAFFDRYIKDKKYTTLVLGDVNKLDFNTLKKYGKVKQLSLEEVFGY
jgi:predicted Zn-dependent peptidase